LRWLNNVTGVLLIGQQGLAIFSGIGRCFPLAGGFYKFLQQRRRKTTNTETTNLSEIQEASRFTFINAQLYSTCDLWE
jgi:hypothetical protein